MGGRRRVGSGAGGGQRRAVERGYAGQVAYADVELSSDLDEAEVTEAADAVRGMVPSVDGVQIELGGFVFAEFEEPSSEVLGVGFAIVILILAFGSVLAMGLPIGVALAGIGVGSIVAGFISFVIHPPSFAALIGIMIGLGVGIDYALFIVTRYRENLRKGHDTRTSVSLAIDTAGRAVLFAGTTAVISLLGMVLMNLGFVTGLAVSAATVVAATMIASLTLLPALLGFAGGRVEVTAGGDCSPPMPSRSVSSEWGWACRPCCWPVSALPPWSSSPASPWRRCVARCRALPLGRSRRRWPTAGAA